MKFMFLKATLLAALLCTRPVDAGELTHDERGNPYDFSPDVAGKMKITPIIRPGCAYEFDPETGMLKITRDETLNGKELPVVRKELPVVQRWEDSLSRFTTDLVFELVGDVPKCQALFKKTFRDLPLKLLPGYEFATPVPGFEVAEKIKEGEFEDCYPRLKQATLERLDGSAVKLEDGSVLLPMKITKYSKVENIREALRRLGRQEAPTSTQICSRADLKKQLFNVKGFDHYLTEGVLIELVCKKTGETLLYVAKKDSTEEPTIFTTIPKRGETCPSNEGLGSYHNSGCPRQFLPYGSPLATPPSSGSNDLFAEYMRLVNGSE